MYFQCIVAIWHTLVFQRKSVTLSNNIPFTNRSKGFLTAATLTLADTFKIGYLSGNRNPDGEIDISLPGLSIRCVQHYNKIIPSRHSIHPLFTSVPPWTSQSGMSTRKEFSRRGIVSGQIWQN